MRGERCGSVGATQPQAADPVGRLRAATGLVGSAPAFLRALDELAHFAAADVPVMIMGETGTGKELAARAVHYLSRRSDGPFIPVNCGALPERLFENELFGHGMGAFTDARAAQRGLIAHAEGGTLLLDEVDCLDRHSQTALLRFLQDHRYRPLGAGVDREADVRIVASTNARMDECTAGGAFRRDLLFRLDVARVELPPLRERREDILPLARHFLKHAAARYQVAMPELSLDVELALLRYHWVGNVRELENVVHRALLLARGAPTITRAPPLLIGEPSSRERDASSGPASRPAAPSFDGTLRDVRARINAAFERDYLYWLLGRTRGNIAAASREAGTERRHLGRMIQRHGIDAKAFRN